MGAATLAPATLQAPATLAPGDPSELGQLRWRCRRGMKELDILLARYVDERFARASACEQDAFRQLLEAQDTELYAYFLGSLAPPAKFAALVGQITATPPVAEGAAPRGC
jgi:antitoxin CptB